MKLEKLGKSRVEGKAGEENKEEPLPIKSDRRDLGLRPQDRTTERISGDVDGLVAGQSSLL